MLPTQLEHEITQWLDGELPPERREMLRRELEENPEARQLVDEHRRLNELLQSAQPMPEVDWIALQDRIVHAVHADEHRRSRWWLGLPLAAAACALIVVGIVATRLNPSSSISPVVESGVAMVTVDGGRSAAETGPAITDIAIGPPADPSRLADLDIGSSDAPSRVAIAGGAAPAQDAILVALAR